MPGVTVYLEPRIVADAWKEWTQRSFVLRAPNEGQFTLCVRLAPAEVYRVMPPVHHASGARTIDSMPVTGPSPAHAMPCSVEEVVDDGGQGGKQRSGLRCPAASTRHHVCLDIRLDGVPGCASAKHWSFGKRLAIAL